MRNSFKLVEEYFWNDDLELTNTKSTTIVLKKGGDTFFIAHIEDREQYLRLLDNYTRFRLTTVTKVRQMRYNEIANKLQENKDRFRQYFI